MPYKLSPSSLSLMKECPRCFWLTQHKVWKRPASIFPSLPSGMDLILKKHFDNFRDKNLLPPEICNNNECKNLKLFGDARLLEKWRDNFRGIRYKDSEGNILFGAIDNLITKGEKLIVLDYKTRGSPCKNDSHIYYQDQMNFYTFLFRKNGYKTEDYAFLLFYSPREVLQKGEIIFDTELVKIKVDVKRAENIWKDALTLLEGECPIKSCEWCKGKI